jgi:hypothetical protein
LILRSSTGRLLSVKIPERLFEIVGTCPGATPNTLKFNQFIMGSPYTP